MRLYETSLAGLALATAAGVTVLWRSPSSYEIRAAALAIGVLLATPYLYMYDLVVLAVPLASLCRLSARGLVLLSEAIGRHAATMPSGRSADLIASACRFAFASS